MIDDFKKACSISYEKLSRYNSIIKVSSKESLGFQDFAEVWRVTSEIEIAENTPEDFNFYICFHSDFPLSFPKIYLSQEDYDRYKYIPHVDTNRFICTFDKNIMSFNPSYPDSIVYCCLKKAKEIVTEGIRRANHKDFEDEFLAYWNNSYAKRDQIFQCLYLADNTDECQSSAKLIFVPQAKNKYDYILHHDGDLSKRFLSYLEKNQIPFLEYEVFYLGEIDFRKQPPFAIQNRDVINFVKSKGRLAEFKRFIKKKNSPAIVLFKQIVSDKTYILGWSHNNLNCNKSGLYKWDRISLDALNYNDPENVIRLDPEIYSGSRIAKRTAGVSFNQTLKFLIAGLGSIGSNLLYFLNSMDCPEFRLVDIDSLETENIGRHLLGFSNVNSYKTKAIENFLLQKRPHQKVKSLNKSIVDIVQNNLDFINDSDYLFIAIGPGNVQDWIGRYVDNKIIKKPVFFIWVEPYLVGGHCLYLNPESDLGYNDFFDENGYFKFNVIDSKEYEKGNPSLYMKEAGCQTTYMPYPLSNIVLFLSQLFPEINDIISNKTQESTSYTWFGAQEILNNKNIKITDYGIGKFQGKLLRN